MRVRFPHADSPRVPAQRSSTQGKSAPKARLKSVADGKQVNSPVLLDTAKGGRRKLGEPENGSSGISVKGGYLGKSGYPLILRREED